ncbi:MAG: hypothetical protein EOL97_04870 [Spirochaetia bacterium]|nr:hypothetical protein [Spirochaetia bacterium]
MSIKNIKAIAQQIIQQTAYVVAPNTVNLMDENGIIVASSDPLRIGTFHSGAFKAIKERREIDIYPNEIDNFEGAKQGVNIPIIKNNEAIAVIGIFGNPDEVKQTAILLSISTSLFLDQADSMKKEQRRITLRSNLSEIISTKNCENEFNETTDALAISIKYPLQAIIFSFNNKKPSYNEIIYFMKNNLLYNSNQDILLEYPSYYILLKSKSNKIDNLMNIKNTLENKDLKKIVFSPTINTIEELYNSIIISKAIMKLPYDRKYYNCNNLDDIILLVFDNKSKDLLLSYFKNIISNLDNSNSYWIYSTIEAYIEKDGKVQNMANYLNIHKNTCIYRLNKILELSKLDTCNCFTVSYFFRAIIHLKKSGKSDIL